MLSCFIEKALKAYVCDDKASQPEDYVSTCLHKGCAGGRFVKAGS